MLEADGADERALVALAAGDSVEKNRTQICRCSGPCGGVGTYVVVNHYHAVFS